MTSKAALECIVASLLMLTVIFLLSKLQWQPKGTSEAIQVTGMGSTGQEADIAATTTRINPLTRQPLSRLIEYDFSHAVIKGNVEHLLDFAIIGHPKCATSFTVKWLNSHSEIQMFKDELGDLRRGNPAELVQHMYELPDGIRGYKNPTDISHAHVLDYFAKYWPKTKLIVGVRHPILWFESFYNYRVRLGYDMPPADSNLLIGKCTTNVHGVCTQQALFHQHLSFLGKTNMTDAAELALLGPLTKQRPQMPLPNKVFLYEINQLYDRNHSRATLYKKDLSDYLGLKMQLTEMEAPHKEKQKQINICEGKYAVLREELLKNAQAASQWIRTFFMDHPDVVVSSPGRFRELLEAWMIDPCGQRVHAASGPQNIEFNT